MLLGDGEEVSGRFLLQDAVDYLDAGHVAFPHGRIPFLEPADVRPQGDAEVTNLAIELKLLQGFEQLVLFQGVDTGVVYLVDVDIVGTQTAQALLASEGHEFPVELLGSFLVAYSGGGLVVKVVAELGGDNDVGAAMPEHFGQKLFPITFTVGVGGIEEVYAQIQGIFQQRGLVMFRDFAPPVGGHCPNPKAHFRQNQVGAR